MNNNDKSCIEENMEFAYNYATFSFLWFSFIVYFGIAYIILWNIFVGIYKSLKEANFYDCLIGLYNRTIKVAPRKIPDNDKEIQTENYSIIPIKSFENKMTCIICYNNGVNIIIKPCQHICICESCYNQLEKKKCPCCNNNIKKIKNLFILQKD